jgi:predicted ATPase
LPTEESPSPDTSVIGKGILSRSAQTSRHQLNTNCGLLSHLRDAEFIFGQSAFQEPEYIFKHALTQEVAVTSARRRRKTLHEQTARAIRARGKPLDTGS